MEIAADHVAIVTDMAIAAEHIDEARVEEARARAAARLREKISDEEVASVNASLARSLAQLQVQAPAAVVSSSAVSSERRRGAGAGGAR